MTNEQREELSNLRKQLLDKYKDAPIDSESVAAHCWAGYAALLSLPKQLQKVKNSRRSLVRTMSRYLKPLTEQSALSYFGEMSEGLRAVIRDDLTELQKAPVRRNKYARILARMELQRRG